MSMMSIEENYSLSGRTLRRMSIALLKKLRKSFA